MQGQPDSSPAWPPPAGPPRLASRRRQTPVPGRTRPRTGSPGQGKGLPRPGARRPPGPGHGGRPIARPLPDPVAIRLGRIPDSAPPYDDEILAGAAAGGNRMPGAPGCPDPDEFAAAIVAALGRSSPVSRGAGEPPDADGQAGGDSAENGGPAGHGAQAGRGGRPGAGTQGRRPVPSQEAWPSRFAQVLAETLAGARPPAQLVPWTTERARSRIRRLGPLLMAGQRPVVRRVVTSLPAPDVMEMAVVVEAGRRVRALAVRLEREQERRAAPGRAGRQAHWMCTAVEAA